MQTSTTASKNDQYTTLEFVLVLTEGRDVHSRPKGQEAIMTTTDRVATTTLTGGRGLWWRTHACRRLTRSVRALAHIHVLLLTLYVVERLGKLLYHFLQPTCFLVWRGRLGKMKSEENARNSACGESAICPQ